MDGVLVTRMDKRDHAYWLQMDLNGARRELSSRYEEVSALRKENASLRAENIKLKQRIKELTELSLPSVREIPSFVKPNIEKGSCRKRGRPPGHAAALRPPPKKIDIRQEVALPKDTRGKPSCPKCRTQLTQLKHHRRIVEDMIPAQLVTTCYRTHSGYCLSCRHRVESRAPDQPPAANVPHAQLGLNALATAAVLRVCYRLPIRQVSRLFEQLPGLKISPSAVNKQIVRLSQWLENEYDRLKLVLRAAGVVHADETGWRIDGRNGYLWTLTNDTHTLYHVNPSRGGKVIADLLGEAFGGTLVSDFYAVYDQFDCPQQKCLTHLLRELRDTVAKNSQLAGLPFFKCCKSLLQEMLRLKQRKAILSKSAYIRQTKSIETRLAHLAQKPYEQAEVKRIAGRLAKYGTRLTTFLHQDPVTGTNNAAERALRPAVVMRKITGGSRSESGAKAWAILASVMRTAEQQGHDLVKTIKTLLRAGWNGEKTTLLTDLFDTS